MFRVVSVVDKEGTALDRLAKGVAPYNKNIDYHVVDVHPKRPSPEQLQRFEQLARTADVIDAQYYRTMDMLRSRYEWLKNIPTVLTHNNPYAIFERDWNDYQVNVGNNFSITKELRNITNSRVEYISLAVDPYFWKFNDNFSKDKAVIMVANRIESKKGILPVAKACKELNIKMYLVGAISDADYWKQVMETGVVQFAQQVSDEDLRDLYYKSTLHVCNSIDNFESGTLPILEAMYCGVPVLTRSIGHVPDFKTESNMFINHHDPENVEQLVKLILDALGDRNRLERMRNDAWMSIKDKNFERRAFQYQKLYRELIEGTPVSVIVPVSGKPDITRENLNAIVNQTHQNIEIIVVDDGVVQQEDNIKNFADTVSVPIRYIRLGGEDYNLAKARNLAAIEATSDILVFCDQRMIMEPTAIQEFLNQLKPNTWLWGNKGVKKDFIENFSCTNRNDFIRFGMFNERITKYGGMSQEARWRARQQSMNLEFVESAKATPKGTSHNRSTKKIDILEMKNICWKMGAV